MASWLTTKSKLGSGRWDYGYHEFHQADYFAQWQKRYASTRLGELIYDDSYGILTPGDVYSVEHPITFLRATDMRSHLQLEISGAFKVPIEYYRHKRARLKKNDVLLAIKGASIASEKSVGFIDFDPKDTLVNGTIFRFQVIEPHNPFYIAVMLDSQILKGQIRKLQIPNNAVSYVDKPSIHALRIPLPPRNVQDRIACIMQEAYTVRKDKSIEAQQLLADIDALVFGKLNIHPESVIEPLRFLKPITALKNGRFDIAFNMGFHKFDPYEEQVKQVSELASFPKETKDPTKEPDETFNYIDISSVNIRTGEIEAAEEIIGADAPSRARQIVHAGDIIISTVRPTRGATAIVPPEMDNYICSTGFTVIQPSKGTSTVYLHAALRLSTTLEQFGRRASGSSYPAILENDIKVSLIPAPSEDIQKEIANEISQRQSEAKQLIRRADNVVADAKAKVERIILGEEEA
jgi:type I restriction enzyme, S subunit